MDGFSLTKIFAYEFFRNAFFAGLIIGVLCSILSVFVVLKRMAFIGQGIAHAAFGGIAFAILLGLNPLWQFITTALFCAAVAVLIGVTSRKAKVSEDSSIGLFLTTSMALGVIFLHLKEGYSQDAFGYLFGNILAVSKLELIQIIILGIVVLGLVIYYYRQLQFFTFDEESATVARVPVSFLYFMLLIVLSLVIVMAAKIIGVVLVSALLIIPGTIALLLGRRFLTVLIISTVIGVTGVVSGLTLSVPFKVPSGAAIVVVLFIFFLISAAARKLMKRSE